ncbi:MAG: GC-type dockerin domain-anchored protein [Phycisphaerales bacterium]|jgi:hypothetical protein
MTRRSRRPTIRAVAAILGAVAATAAAHGQTVCGAWEPLVADLLGDIGGTRTRVSDLIVFDAGDGPMLYMAGNFEAVVDPVFGEVRAPGLARFDGERWEAVPGLDGPGLELDRRAIEMHVFDDGSGPALFVGGEFTMAGGQPATGIARWDGVTWSGLGGPGVPGGLTRIYDIHHHDFGDGPMLYAGGLVFKGDGLPLEFIWRWDGSAWSQPGDGQPFNDEVYELASFDGHLFASGRFQSIGGEPVPGIARFDGTMWSLPLGSDQRISANRFWPLLPTELDGQEVLLAAGQFSIDEGGTLIAFNLACWDGQRWDSPTTEPAFSVRTPTTLATFDDGSGSDLFVAGGQLVGRSNVNRLLDRELSPTTPLGIDIVYELFVYDDGTGPALLAGGEDQVAGRGLPFLARWNPAAPCPADASGDCVLDVFDFLAFQDLFMAGDPAADFDGDGVFTIFDFLAFQNAFDTGCP